MIILGVLCINYFFDAGRGETMQISYKKLWKILIDKDMKKKDLQSKANISWTTITKMSKNEKVSLDMLMKICEALDCNIGDVIEFVPDNFSSTSSISDISDSSLS